MKASEVIEQLQALIAEHGDLAVEVAKSDWPAEVTHVFHQPFYGAAFVVSPYSP